MQVTSGFLGPPTAPLQAEPTNLEGFFQKLRTKFATAGSEWLVEFQNYKPTPGATANSIYDDLSRITINLVPHMVSARQAACFYEDCLPGRLKRVISPKLRAEEQRRDGAGFPKMSMADVRDIAISQERA